MPDEQPLETTVKTVVKSSPPGQPAKVEVTTTTTSPLKALGSWTVGIIGAFISGAAAAVSGGFGGMIVAPETFNLHGGGTKILQLAMATALIPGIVSLAKYLQFHPVPGQWTGEERRGDNP